MISSELKRGSVDLGSVFCPSFAASFPLEVVVTVLFLVQSELSISEIFTFLFQ